MIELTIIIPAYNRLKILKKVLDALNRQNYDLKKIEVLILDDHSDINPKSEILKIKNKLKYNLRFFRLKKNVGQGRVRNQAIKLAKGEYLFFIGDDTIPKEDFIREHMELHNRYNGIAVLGRVFWHNSLRNEFMNYIEKIQFHYNTIKDKNDVKLHFYTSNLSLEKSWFKNEGYNKMFKNYGFEDLELGYRLEKKGLRVVYNPNAIVYHFHQYNFEQFCKRMLNVGRSVVIFTKLHPELKKKYILPFHNVFKFGSFVLSNKFFKYINKKTYWYSNFVYSYLIGIEEGFKNVEKTKSVCSLLYI